MLLYENTEKQQWNHPSPISVSSYMPAMFVSLLTITHLLPVLRHETCNKLFSIVCRSNKSQNTRYCNCVLYVLVKMVFPLIFPTIHYKFHNTSIDALPRNSIISYNVDNISNELGWAFIYIYVYTKGWEGEIILWMQIRSINPTCLKD